MLQGLLVLWNAALRGSWQTKDRITLLSCLLGDQDNRVNLLTAAITIPASRRVAPGGMVIAVPSLADRAEEYGRPAAHAACPVFPYTMIVCRTLRWC
jgi:hypothetical protein